MYVVIDFETTGLNKNGTDQVIEMAAIRLTSDGYNAGSLHQLVQLREGKKLPEFIVEYTGITEEDLNKHGVSEVYAFEQLQNFIQEGDILIAQFASFDMQFLPESILEKLDGFYCTKSINFLEAPDKPTSLVKAAERLGIPLEKAHTAFDDAAATAELFKYYLDTLGFAMLGYKDVMVIDKRPLPYIPSYAKVKDFRQKDVDSKQFREDAIRTMNTDMDKKERLTMLALGLGGESGELQELIKKMVYHQHPEEELKRKITFEAGDVMWYLELLLHEFGITMDEVYRFNVEKRSKRYPKGFSAEDSQKRIDVEPK